MYNEFFKIGDQVKLYNYSYHADYMKHIDQIAIITHYYDTAHRNYKFQITWSDGDISDCSEDNLIHVNTEWNDDENKS